MKDVANNGMLVVDAYSGRLVQTDQEMSSYRMRSTQRLDEVRESSLGQSDGQSERESWGGEYFKDYRVHVIWKGSTTPMVNMQDLARRVREENPLTSKEENSLPPFAIAAGVAAVAALVLVGPGQLLSSTASVLSTKIPLVAALAMTGVGFIAGRATAPENENKPNTAK